MAYVTLSEYRAYMSAMSGGTPATYTAADDTFHTNLLASAQTLIERETKRHFEATTATHYYDASKIDYNDQQRILLDDDLLAVTTLTNGDGTVIAAANFWLMPLNVVPKFAIKLKSTATWTFSDDTLISVAGTWGYSTVADYDVKRVTMRLAYLEQQRRSATGQVAVLGNGETMYEAAVPQDIARWLNKMRREGGW